MLQGPGIILQRIIRFSQNKLSKLKSETRTSAGFVTGDRLDTYSTYPLPGDAIAIILLEALEHEFSCGWRR